MGAPKWPPIPPSARSAPAKPWRSSVLRQLFLVFQPEDRAVEGLDHHVDVFVAHRAVHPAVPRAAAVVHAVEQHREMEWATERAHPAIEARGVHRIGRDTELLCRGTAPA